MWTSQRRSPRTTGTHRSLLLCIACNRQTGRKTLQAVVSAAASTRGRVSRAHQHNKITGATVVAAGGGLYVHQSEEQ
jgi:hypothetical protein